MPRFLIRTATGGPVDATGPHFSDHHRRYSAIRHEGNDRVAANARNFPVKDMDMEMDMDMNDARRASIEPREMALQNPRA
ncbi:MAG: hypothetical protein IT489_11420 [Gammaproteobacteria bacterium]|nr:hypothetical protein [Gammaproteobacteria bacterium]